LGGISGSADARHITNHISSIQSPVANTTSDTTFPSRSPWKGSRRTRGRFVRGKCGELQEVSVSGSF